PPEPFSVQRVADDGVTVLVVGGHLDLATARRFRRAVADLSGPVVADLNDCGFLDSTGLSALLDARQRLGPGFAVTARPDGAPARTLRLTVGELLAVHPTRAAAVREVRRAGA
ncbi:MAG: anti-anti-sigma factor, partial [Solirubrobacterales bacterium]|nr:anti-anti-sigma factor [Solirubrobacterales bacterium]